MAGCHGFLDTTSESLGYLWGHESCQLLCLRTNFENLHRLDCFHQPLLKLNPPPLLQPVLLANLEVGFHEQTRLQPEIREAMDAPIYEPGALRRRLMDELFPNPTSQWRLAAARLTGRADPLLAARDRLAKETQRLGRLAITDQLMTLELPGGRVLHLSDPLRAEVPAPLRALANPDLHALLAPLRDAPVADWSDLPSRMSYIAALFRAYHADAGLFGPPFTPAQTAALKAGQRPSDL